MGEQVFVQELQDKADEVHLLLLTGRFVNAKDAQSDLLFVGKVEEEDWVA